MSSSSSSTSLPANPRKIVAHTLSSDFRKATKIVEAKVPSQLGADQVLVRNVWVGINASDINYTAGKYTAGVKLPMDTGFESIGVVTAVGSEVKNLKVGQAVAGTSFGAFSDVQVQRAKQLLPVPAVEARFLPLLVSGLTASLALEHVGELKPAAEMGGPKVVVVTAAAGGTGLFAVQLAKWLGHTVIATCSSDSKSAVLRKLGADRVVNYKKERLYEVLKNEYPKGVDVVYESVGGQQFEDCVRCLAVKGKLIVIGFVSGYADGSAWKAAAKPAAPAPSSSSSDASDSAALGSSNSGGGKAKKKAVAPTGPMPSLPAMILGKSASIRGFFLNDYAADIPRHMALLTGLMAKGQLQSIVDTSKSFVGLEQVADAIDFLYQGSNVGKVVVRLDQPSAAKQQQPIKSKL